MTINVMIADDHTIVRDGLKVLLEANPDIKVVGGVSNGRQLLDTVKELLPDIVIMDISMPEMNGIVATREIAQILPQVRIIMLSMLATADHVFHALQAGARGFVLKESASREVMEAVIAVYGGEVYFSQPIMSTMVNDYIQFRNENESVLLNNLSTREHEILCLVIEGKTSAEIGKCLNLSPKTIESYRSRMMQKLGISDLPELIKFAIKNGLISLE